MKSFSINIVFLVLSIVGILLIKDLSVTLNAKSGEKRLSIHYAFPEASAHSVEQEITSKIEQAANSIRGLKEIKSRSSYGKGEINCVFDKHVSLDFARFELASAIRRLYPSFPLGVSYPQISLNKPDDQKQNSAFMIYSVFAPDNLSTIFEYTKQQIEPKLSTINALSKVNVSGATPTYIKIIYNSLQLKLYNLNSRKLNEKISANFTKKSLGQVSTNKYESTYALLDNKVSDTINWEALPITKIDGKIIYLGELAKISMEQERAQSFFRINGKNAINIALYPNFDANELQLSKEIEQQISQIEKQLPPNYKLVKNYNSTDFIKEELTTIAYRSVATLAILLSFVFLISLNIKYLTVILIGFLANIFIAIIFYSVLNISINLYSLAGITVSLGLIIDNSIVMIEHYSHEKNRKVFLALFASTLTSIAALSSIFLLEEKVKTQLFDFAAIIIINLTVSLFIALFFIPALLNKIKFRNKNKKKQYRKLRLLVRFNRNYFKTIQFLQKRKKIVFIALILSFGLPVFLLPNKINSDKFYANIYNYTLGAEIYTENIKPVVNKVLGGSFRLFYHYVFENMSFSNKEEVQLYVMTSSRKNHKVEHINGIYKSFENYLSSFNEIESFQTQINSVRSAQINIRFKPEYEKGNFPFQLKSRLISLAADMDAFNWNIFGVGEGFSSYNGNKILQYGISVYGYNYDQLSEQTQILTKKLKKHPRVQSVETVSSRSWQRNQKPEQQVLLFDNFMLQNYHLNAAKIYQNLQELTQKYGANSYIFDRNKYLYYKLEDKLATNFDSWKLKNIQIGDSSKIKALLGTNLIKKKPEQDVVRENNEYKQIVELEYLGVRKFADKHIDEVISEMENQMPMGYHLERIKDNFYYFKQEEPKKYGLLLLVFVLIFIICTILFESFKQSFIVLSVVPISYIGLFLAFYLFDIGFDQGGYAAFLLLSGITVNSALYIINDYNNLTKTLKNKNNFKIYVKAFNKKIIPILLTIFSTILGLIPFLFFSENSVFWQALAVGSIGGLIASFLAILFVLPLFFNNTKQEYVKQHVLHIYTRSK